MKEFSFSFLYLQFFLFVIKIFCRKNKILIFFHICIVPLGFEFLWERRTSQNMAHLVNKKKFIAQLNCSTRPRALVDFWQQEAFVLEDFEKLFRVSIDRSWRQNLKKKYFLLPFASLRTLLSFSLSSLVALIRTPRAPN